MFGCRSSNSLPHDRKFVRGTVPFPGIGRAEEINERDGWGDRRPVVSQRTLGNYCRYDHENNLPAVVRLGAVVSHNRLGVGGIDVEHVAVPTGETGP